MFHLLFALQEIATYKNVVKCKHDKSLKDYSFTDDGFLLYNNCAAAGSDPIYCYEACNEGACPTTGFTVDSTKDLILPVEDQFIISFNVLSGARNVFEAIDDELCDRAEVTLNGAVGEKKTFYLITCIMFWVAFLLIVATFVLALISIANCGCCRCCNSVKSIFPMKSTVGSAWVANKVKLNKKYLKKLYFLENGF